MNNIHAKVDEIMRTGDKEAIVSLSLQMQLNYLRATEAETKLAAALKALRAIYQWNVTEVEQFGGFLPDDEILDAVKAVLGETE